MLYINESMAVTPSGTVKGNASYVSPSYVLLTPASNNQVGEVEYTKTLSTSFVIEADLWANGSADAGFVYWGCSSTPTSEDSASGGYFVNLDEFEGQVQLRFNGTSLATQAYASLGNSTIRTLRVVVNGTLIKIYVAGVLQITYTDIVRTLPGSLCGVCGRTGGQNGQHRCYRLQFYDNPTVVTGAISSITSTAAQVALTSYQDGSDTITARGIQFATTQNPDRSTDEAGSFSASSFNEAMANLFPNNNYYVRGYATNSAGTGYGSWVSFSTAADVYKITINGINRTADILSKTINIDDSINDKQTIASFDLIDRQSLGPPLTDQEVIMTLNSGAIIFGGYTLKISKGSLRGSLFIYHIECVDYTRLLDRNLVNKTYISKTDQYIIQDIINSFCQGSGITYTNVQLGVTIDQIAFNYIQPSKALRVLSDLTGRNWYIDYSKDVHYFPITTNPSPFNITDSQTFSGNQGYDNFQIASDASQIKNRVYVRGGTKLSDATTHSQKGDSSKKKFVLPDKPHSVSVAVNGVTKTLGIKNIDTSGFDFYLEFEEKYIEQDPAATVLATTDVLTVNYTYDIPILVAVENQASIVTSGVHEFIIVDNSITTTQAARDRASAELTDYANNIVEGQFNTYTDGFRSGQYININSTILGITNTNYIVQKVHAASMGGGKYQYTVYLASAKTMGIIRFLLELLEQNKNLAQVATNEVLDNLLSLNDSLDPNSLVDALTIDSAGPYRTWCKDSLEATITRARFGLFQWG